MSFRSSLAFMACGALLSLSACMVGPTYERAVPSELDDWGFTAQLDDADGIALANVSWFEIFRDDELESLMARALERNRNLLAAVERVEEARALGRVAEAARWPELTARNAYEREYESGLTNTAPEIVDEYFLGLDLAWELDMWGRNRRASDAAFANYLATAYGAQAVRLSVLAEVARAYFQLRGIRDRVAISRNTVEAREHQLSIAQKRFSGGLTSRLEVTQSEVDLAATRAVLLKVEEAEVLAENRLSILLGELPSSHSFADSDSAAHVPPGVTAGLPIELLDRRPDIMAAEQRLLAASEAVGIATANLLPSIQLTGSLGTETMEFNDFLETDGRYWIWNLDLVMPIFDAGGRRARLTAAESRFNQARLAWEQSVLEALKEVADALVRFRKASDVLEAELVLERASAEYFELALKRYRNGVLGYINVLDAQRGLFLAQIAVSQARQSQLLALVDLYRALGGGWDPAALLTGVE